MMNRAWLSHRVTRGVEGGSGSGSNRDRSVLVYLTTSNEAVQTCSPWLTSQCQSGGGLRGGGGWRKAVWFKLDPPRLFEMEPTLGLEDDLTYCLSKCK